MTGLVDEMELRPRFMVDRLEPTVSVPFWESDNVVTACTCPVRKQPQAQSLLAARLVIVHAIKYPRLGRGEGLESRSCGQKIYGRNGPVLILYSLGVVGYLDVWAMRSTLLFSCLCKTYAGLTFGKTEPPVTSLSNFPELDPPHSSHKRLPSGLQTPLEG